MTKLQLGMVHSTSQRIDVDGYDSGSRSWPHREDVRPGRERGDSLDRAAGALAGASADFSWAGRYSGFRLTGEAQSRLSLLWPR
jgi:hypothetical protein